MLIFEAENGLVLELRTQTKLPLYKHRAMDKNCAAVDIASLL